MLYRHKPNCMYNNNNKQDISTYLLALNETANCHSSAASNHSFNGKITNHNNSNLSLSTDICIA